MGLITKQKRSKKGLTLIELLIVATIVAVLILALLWFFGNQAGRSRDAKRKTDLERIKISFEDYFNDNECYPPVGTLEDCRGESFRPYLSKIPCDPMTDQPYLYVPLDGNQCKAYRVYAGLEDKSDPVVSFLGCSGQSGCGYGPNYNYGIAVGVSVFDPDGTYISPTPSPSPSLAPSPSTSPSPTPNIYVYACDPAGICNQYESNNPFLINCPVTYLNTNCDNSCADPVNRCSG